MKACSKCGVVKPLAEFHNSSSITSGKVARCKPCTLAALYAQKARDPAKAAEAVKSWVARNRARSNEIKAKYVAAHPERRKDTTNRWSRENRPKENAKLARYRAKQKQATPKWASKFIIGEAYELADLRTKALGFKWEVDHIVPLQSRIVCGLHCEANLQVIPAAKNKSKGNHYWPDMPEQRA